MVETISLEIDKCKSRNAASVSKPDIEPENPCLYGGEFIYFTTAAPPQRLLCFDGFETILYKYDWPLELFGILLFGI